MDVIYAETRRRLPRLQPFSLVGAGLLLAILNAVVSAALTTSFIFEVAICLTVLGGASMMLAVLGHPKDEAGEVRLGEQPIQSHKERPI